jgi:hypothetical protein
MPRVSLDVTTGLERGQAFEQPHLHETASKLGIDEHNVELGVLRQADHGVDASHGELRSQVNPGTDDHKIAANPAGREGIATVLHQRECAEARTRVAEASDTRASDSYFKRQPRQSTYSSRRAPEGRARGRPVR